MEDNNELEAIQGEDFGEEMTDKGKKTFTSDEVNQIIQKRLNQMKKQASKEQEAEYSKKFQELHEREMKLAMNEELANRNLPKKFADIIFCSDEEDMKKKIDVLNEIMFEARTQKSESPKSVYKPKNGTFSHDEIRDAMGLD